MFCLTHNSIPRGMFCLGHNMTTYWCKGPNIPYLLRYFLVTATLSIDITITTVEGREVYIQITITTVEGREVSIQIGGPQRTDSPTKEGGSGLQRYKEERCYDPDRTFHQGCCYEPEHSRDYCDPARTFHHSSQNSLESSSSLFCLSKMNI